MDSTWPNLTKIGPEFLQRQAQALRRAAALASSLRTPANGRSSHSQRPNAVVFEQVVEAVPQQHAGDAQRARTRSRLMRRRPCLRAQARRRAPQALGVVAQVVDIVVEGGELGLGDHVARFLGDVLGGVAGEVLGAACAGLQALAQHARDLRAR